MVLYIYRIFDHELLGLFGRFSSRKVFQWFKETPKKQVLVNFDYMVDFCQLIGNPNPKYRNIKRPDKTYPKVQDALRLLGRAWISYFNLISVEIYFQIPFMFYLMDQFFYINKYSFTYNIQFKNPFNQNSRGTTENIWITCYRQFIYV